MSDNQAPFVRLVPTQHPRVFRIEHTFDVKEPKVLGTVDARGVEPVFAFYAGVTVIADQLREITRQTEAMLKIAQPKRPDPGRWRVLKADGGMRTELFSGDAQTAFERLNALAGREEKALILTPSGGTIYPRAFQLRARIPATAPASPSHSEEILVDEGNKKDMIARASDLFQEGCDVRVIAPDGTPCWTTAGESPVVPAEVVAAGVPFSKVRVEMPIVQPLAAAAATINPDSKVLHDLPLNVRSDLWRLVGMLLKVAWRLEERKRADDMSQRMDSSRHHYTEGVLDAMAAITSFYLQGHASESCDGVLSMGTIRSTLAHFHTLSPDELAERVASLWQRLPQHARNQWAQWSGFAVIQDLRTALSHYIALGADLNKADSTEKQRAVILCWQSMGFEKIALAAELNSRSYAAP